MFRDSFIPLGAANVGVTIGSWPWRFWPFVAQFPRTQQPQTPLQTIARSRSGTWGFCIIEPIFRCGHSITDAVECAARR